MARFRIAGGVAGTVLVGAARASAQALDVPGDSARLQAALDAAPSGAVIRVHGGVWGSITIRRPVVLLGDPAPLLEGGPTGLESPIVLEGAGSGEVVLSRIRTGAGVPDAVAPGVLPPAIQGGGFDELHVYDSDVAAVERSGFSGLGYGGAAIDVDVPFVVVERSRLQASRTDIDDACTPSAPQPAPGLRAPGTVVLLDSEVHGGDSGRWQHDGWPAAEDCDPLSCPPGPGGIGVVCATLHHAGSTIVGGRGARWSTCSGSSCCENPPGLAWQVVHENPLANELVGRGPMRPGGTYELVLSAPGPLAALLAALGARPPVPVPGLGLSFLEPATTVSLGPHATPGVARIVFPLDPSLLGRTVAFQLVDPTSGFSRPVVGVLYEGLLRGGVPGATLVR